MAVAGSAGPGVWMKLEGGRLVQGRPCTTTAQVRQLDEAVTAILAGYHVHVDNYRGLDRAVAAEVEKRLEQGEGLPLSPATPLTYIPGITKLGESK